MVATFNADGTFTASATVDNVTLASGYTIKNAAITVSTVTNTASILPYRSKTWSARWRIW